MRINLGAGDRYVQGWHNVDFESPHPVDERVDLTGPIPWRPGEVAEVYAGHVLEHISEFDCLTLLDRLRHCMAPEGRIMVVGPDVEKAEYMVAVGTFDHTWGTLDAIKHGGNRWPGDVHQWECTGWKVKDLLRVAGWSNIVDVGIQNVPPHWPVADRTQLWQCAIGATA